MKPTSQMRQNIDEARRLVELSAKKATMIESWAYANDPSAMTAIINESSALARLLTGIATYLERIDADAS